LAKAPIQCLEYVVVRDLTPLLARHHRKRFAALLDKHLPQWRQAREMLKGTPPVYEHRVGGDAVDELEEGVAAGIGRLVWGAGGLGASWAKTARIGEVVTPA
jgi:hypothetical protein